MIHAHITNYTGDQNLANNSTVSTNEMSRSAAPLPPGLVSWWPAEGNAMDALGRNSLRTNATVSFAPGRVGYSFRFNGDANPLVADNNPTLDIAINEGFSIECWIRVDRLPADGVMEVARRMPDDVTQDGIGWRLYFQDGALKFYYRDSLSTEAIISNVTLSRFDRWRHVVVVSRMRSTGRDFQFWLDNTLGGQGSLSNGEIRNNAPLVVGRSFFGRIDEISFSKTTAADATLAFPNIYGAGVQGKSPTGIDSNQNGIPDAWEYAAAQGWSSAWQDRDGDGIFDSEELVAGTSPINAADVFKFSVTPTNTQGNIQVKYVAMAGRTYRVQRALSLQGRDTVWETLNKYVSGSTPSNAAVTVAPPFDGFYRVMVEY